MSGCKKLFWMTAFGIAFALVEAAVVVYLRAHYYPEGFKFPTGMLPANILRTEIIREAATMVMLIAIGMLAGRTTLGRLSAFLIVFGVWDIFYYIWLKLFLDWPETLLDWDILFLIPGPWAAPVLAPLLVCVAFIACGVWIFWREDREYLIRLRPVDLAVVASAAVVIILSFLINDGTSIPKSFPWWLFFIGLLGGVGYFVWRLVRFKKSTDT